MTYHYHGIDAEESILNKSLPNLGTWALPNLFFIIKTRVTEVSLPKWSSVHTVISLKGQCGERAGKFTCCTVGKGT